MAWSGALADVHAVLEAQRVAWNAGNLARFMEGYEQPGADITFVSPAGVRRGYAQLAADYGARYADKAAMGTLDFRDLELRLVCDTVALGFGRFVLMPAGEGAQQASGMFSLVLRRGEAGWRIVHDHTS